MATLTVEIGGREYRLACDDGQEEQLIGLSQEVNERVNILSEQIPLAGEGMLLVLAALTLADELADTRRHMRQLQVDVNQMQRHIENEQFAVADQARLMQLEAAMAETLSDVAQRIEVLTKRLEAAA